MTHVFDRYLTLRETQARAQTRLDELIAFGRDEDRQLQLATHLEKIAEQIARVVLSTNSLNAYRKERANARAGAEEVLRRQAARLAR